MNTNPVSYRAKQQNLLKSKTQTFLQYFLFHIVTTAKVAIAFSRVPRCIILQALYFSTNSDLFQSSKSTDVSSEARKQVSGIPADKILEP